MNQYMKMLEELKPRVFEVELLIERMYEVQDRSLEKELEREKTSEVHIEEKKSEGVPEEKELNEGEQVKAPERETFRTTTEAKTKAELMHKYYITEDDKLLLYLGDPYGILRTDMRNAIKAMGKRGYRYLPVVDLIQIEPQWVEVGKGPIDGTDTVLEKRVMKFGREFRQTVQYEYVGKGLLPDSPHNGDRHAVVRLKIARECPLQTKEIIALLDAMQRLHGCGPSKRGRYHIVNIKKIND